ncbi:MAG: hypothetical protein JSW64_02035 [Candidatus Zixiibacteriota bacterium]|nr:MAG: hypothetical protein JSW64_02035 [candidate division Zixibacteria bacterium]
MIARQENGKETKKQNTHLRRSTMNATKLTMIVFSATAILLGGCSRDNRVTGPGNVENSEINADLTTTVETENHAARIAVRSEEQKIERMGFAATVKKSEVEGGCWYLETVRFTRYTPYFEESAPGLRVGLKLEVYGYVDENMNSYCMIGQVFRIEKYKILSRDEYEPTFDFHMRNADEDAARSTMPDADIYAPASIDAEPKDAKTTLKGYFFRNDEGCIYISDGKEIIVELHFMQKKLPVIPNGRMIAVEGEYSLLAWSPCQLAPLFYVESLHLLDGSDLVAKDGSAGK